MNFYDDYGKTHRREPSREELEAEYNRLQDEDLESYDQALDTVREIAAALGVEPEQPKPVKTCTHLREDGRGCGSIAVKDRDFCSFHLNDRGRRLRMARNRARRQRVGLQLPPLEDLYAVQVSIMQVLEALGHGQVDWRVARTMLSGLQHPAANLRRPVEEWEKSRPFQSQSKDEKQQLELPGFEAEFGLHEGMDLNTPPDEAFPETEKPVALNEEHINLMEVAPTDIELMEIRQYQGPDAVWHRVKKLDAAEQQRYKRAQKQLAHARHVVRAAAQNAARETVYVARSEADLAAAEAAERAAAEAQAKTAAGDPAASICAGEATGTAGAPPFDKLRAGSLSASVADSGEEKTAGAPPLSPSFGDRVGIDRKEPQPAAGEAEAPERKLG